MQYLRNTFFQQITPTLFPVDTIRIIAVRFRGLSSGYCDILSVININEGGSQSPTRHQLPVVS